MKNIREVRSVKKNNVYHTRNSTTLSHILRHEYDMGGDKHPIHDEREPVVSTVHQHCHGDPSNDAPDAVSLCIVPEKDERQIQHIHSTRGR